MSTTPMETNLDQQPTRRSKRAGARKSVEQLQERARAIAAEETAALWGAGVEEDEEDQSFDEAELSDKGEDIVDSDFDDPEEREETQAESTEPKREISRAIRARGKYVDPAEKERRVKRRAAKRKSTNTENEKRKQKSAATSPPAVGRASLRKSTKIASELAAEARAARDEASRKRSRKEPVVFTMPTQQELMDESKITEVANRESLEQLLRLEAEKKRQFTPREKDHGPIISTRNHNGKSTISFTDPETDVHSILFPQNKSKKFDDESKKGNVQG